VQHATIQFLHVQLYMIKTRCMLYTCHGQLGLLIRLYSEMMPQLDMLLCCPYSHAGARLRGTAAGSARWQHGHCTGPHARRCSASSRRRVTLKHGHREG
jgi:hypothetical protein